MVIFDGIIAGRMGPDLFSRRRKDLATDWTRMKHGFARAVAIFRTTKGSNLRAASRILRCRKVTKVTTEGTTKDPARPSAATKLFPPLCGGWFTFSVARRIVNVSIVELSSGSTEGGRPLRLRLRIVPAVARAMRRRRRKGLTRSAGTASQRRKAQPLWV